MAQLGAQISVGTVGPSNVPTIGYSNLYLVGHSPWGVANVATPCNSFAQFVRLFGGLNALTTLAADGSSDTWGTETSAKVRYAYYTAKAYFDEKGPNSPGILWFVRAVKSSGGPSAATRTFNDGGANNTTITSKWVGDPGEAIAITIANYTSYVLITVDFSVSGATVMRETWRIANSEDASNASLNSQMVTITLPAGGQLPAAVASAQKLGNGSAATADAYDAADSDFVGSVSSANVKTGIQCFNDLRLGTGFLSVAGNVSSTVRTGIKTHCANYKKIGLVPTASGKNLSNAATDISGVSGDELYSVTPWVYTVSDASQQGGQYLVPPDGFIAGLAARMDGEYRGPHKSPAGITHGLNSAVGLEVQSGTNAELYDDSGSNTLADSYVNTLRLKPGPIVWGLRTLSTNERFRQINVVRTLHVVWLSLYFEIEKLAFEPIDSAGNLFAKAQGTAASFLARLHRDGVFYGNAPGAKPSANDAYQAICDKGNNTKETLMAGELILDVLIVPTPNAETVRMKIEVASPGFARAAANA